MSTAAAKPAHVMSRGERIWEFVERINMLTVPLVLIVIIMSFLSDRFLTSQNIYNVLRASAIYIIIGVGQAFLMTSKTIDLSVGSMLGLVMGFTGSYLFFGGNAPVAMLMALGLGLAFGVINGLLVTRLNAPPLLATLGMLVAYRGVLQQYLYGTTVSRFPPAIKVLGQGTVAGIPVPVIIAAAVAVIGALLYRHTKFARYAIAIGDNEEAAVLAGIRVKRWKLVFYLFQGLLVGVAALVFLGRIDSAHPGIGTGLELHVIAGVALGGTSLFGGKGTMWGVVLGMVLIAVLSNGLLLAGAGFFVQQIFLGVLLVASVALQVARSRNKAAA